MTEGVREFIRGDREQLANLVNLHVGAVLPGVWLSTNVVLSQLEREPGEVVVDPWVIDRRCLVAVANGAVVAAALVHRFGRDEPVRNDARGAASLRWLVCQPNHLETGRQLLEAVARLARTWESTRIFVDSCLPAPGCCGVANTWPHIREILVDAGYVGPDRLETVLAARCSDLVGSDLDDATVVRSVGTLGTRLDLATHDGPQGWVEVCGAGANLSRSSAASGWADIGNLFPADGVDLTAVMPALLSAAADWLLLGGVERLIDYYAADVHRPEYMDLLTEAGFTTLTVNARGWTRELRGG